MKKKQSIKIDFPANEKYFSPARLAISGLANQADFSVQEIEEIKNSFSEACQLALNNAYFEEKPDKRLTVQCQVNKNVLSFSIRNNGVEINITKKRSAR